MLETEYNFFIENKNDLVQTHLGNYIVIVGQSVVGAYPSNQEAYFEALKTYKPGTFLIQFCSKDERVYHQSFHTRVGYINE